VLRARRLKLHGNIEISQERIPVGVEENIGRFDVAMNDFALMRSVQCLPHLGEDSQDFFCRKQIWQLSLDAVLERATGSILSHDVGKSFMRPDIKNGQNVGMFEKFKETCFPEKAITFLRRTELGSIQQLDGNDAIDKMDMLGEIDNARSSPGEFLDDS